MLDFEDIERIMETAEDVGYTLSEEEAQTLWERHSESTGAKELPFSYAELVDIVSKYCLQPA